MQHSPVRVYRPLRSRRIIAASLIWATLFFLLASYAATTFATLKAETARAQAIETTAQQNTTETTKTSSSEEAKKSTSSEKKAKTKTSSQPNTQAARVVSTPAPRPAPTPTPAYDTVSIPAIGLSSRIVTVGLTAQGAIDVHLSLVGWWNGSAQIGQPGAAFLDGHNPGVFSKLPNVRKGAEISVKKSNGKVFSYTVVETETVKLEEVNMRRALRPSYGHSEGLNLMTCVGAYNPSKGTTDYRFIVYAVRS